MESNTKQLRTFDLRCVGVKFRKDVNRKLLEEYFNDGMILPLRIEEEPDNPHDEFALKLISDGDFGKDTFIGYVGRPENKILFPLLRQGDVTLVRVYMTSYHVDLDVGLVKIEIEIG